MSTHGLNTFLADPSGTAVGPEWCDLITSLGITQVRCTIDADANNQLNLPVYAQSADVYRAHGIEVLAVLTMGTDMPWKSTNIDRHFYPNEDLGYQGNPRANRYIRDFGLRAQGIAHALVPHGITRFALYNESNEYGLLKPGQNVPPTGQKPASLAPEVWASLCYECAGYLRAGGATDIQAGSLSWVGNGVTGTDAHNPYGAGYIFAGLSYLRGTGVASLPWSHLAVNAELTWTTPETQARRAASDAAVKAAGYQPLPFTIGEWGSTNAVLEPAKAPITAAALAAVGDVLYFEQAPLQGTPTGYGLHGWSVAANTFVPTATRTAWWPVYQTILKGATV